MTTQKTYTNKSNAARAGKAANGGTLDGLTLLGETNAWYYAKLDDVGDNHTATPAAQLDEGAMLHNLVQATNTVALAGLQAEAAAAPKAKAAKAAKTPKAAKAPAKPVVANHALVTAKGAAPRATAKRAPAAKPAKTAPATSKEIADAYPKGVGKVPANAKKGTRTVTGYKLEQERAESHGVQRKSRGTVGDQLWALFYKALGDLRKKVKDAGAKDLMLGAVRKVGTDAGFNNTTVALAFYQWRRFHGVRGRGKKQKVD